VGGVSTRVGVIKGAGGEDFWGCVGGGGIGA